MKYLLRPLTKRMIDQLLFVRNLELSRSENDIVLTHHFKNSMPGLFRRGLIDTRMVTINGKQLMNVYITKSGIDFLKDYEKNNSDKIHTH